MRKIKGWVQPLDSGYRYRINYITVHSRARSNPLARFLFPPWRGRIAGMIVELITTVLLILFVFYWIIGAMVASARDRDKKRRRR